MKILLLQSYLGRHDPFGPVFPLGLCYIATALAGKGHDIRVVDMNLFADPYRQTEEAIRNFDPEVVGISLRNIDTTQRNDVFYHFKTVAPTARLIKSVNPGIKIVIGGAGFSMFAEKIMRRIPELDFGVYLEGEETITELVERLDNPAWVRSLFIRDGENVVFTGPRPLPDMAALPIPRRDFVDMNAYKGIHYKLIGIQTKRGCPFRCSYCAYPNLNGVRVRVRAPESVVDEIEYLIREFDVRGFSFADSVFNVPSGHAEAICREIIRRKLDVKWDAWFEMSGFTEELMLLAREAGCVSVGFSPDAVTDESLKAMGKNIKEKDIYRVLGIARKTKGVVFGFSLFCTPPKQDFIGVLKTIKLYFAVLISLFGRGGVGLGWVRVEPDTRMHAIALADGVLKADDDLLPDDERGLEKLFYSCPKTGFYADPVFSVLESAKSFMRGLARKILRRKKAVRKIAPEPVQ